MNRHDARIRSRFRLGIAISRTRRPPPLRRPRGDPDGDAVPVVTPRTPTLSGGAAASMEAEKLAT